ncbi:MAG: CvpA family protein [Anaerolineae bacterium]|nr:CvpA family protein [Phycisphaerae bacterium]
MDANPLILLVSALLLMVWQTWRGWRLGLARQLVNLLALIAAYAVAIFGGRLVLPVLRPLGYPDMLLAVVSGAVLGLIIFGAISGLGALLFKKTSQQSLGLVRMGYGATGAAIGLLFGLFTVWLMVLGIRVLGTVAESEVRVARADALMHQPGKVVQRLAGMKHSLEQGRTGEMMNQVDPIPADFYGLLHKISLTVSNPESVNRFLHYPGAQELAEHPRIQALQRDPTVTREIEDRNYLALLRNEQIVQAANDPELHRLVRRFELQKALDYALRN